MKTTMLTLAIGLLAGCSSPGSYDWFRSTTQYEIHRYYSEQCRAAGYKAGTKTHLECTDREMQQGWEGAKAENAS